MAMEALPILQFPHNDRPTPRRQPIVVVWLVAELLAEAAYIGPSMNDNRNNISNNYSIHMIQKRNSYWQDSGNDEWQEDPPPAQKALTRYYSIKEITKTYEEEKRI